MVQPQKISTCLWFDKDGEEAAKFYTALFPDSAITNVSRYGANQPLPEGTALMVNFTLAGAAFSALNGGPMFKPDEAVSIVVSCEDQDEIDTYWNALTGNGGSEGQCGWCKDRWGFSWQIIPSRLGALMSGDSAAAARVFAAFMPMKKLEIAALEAAFRG